MVCAVALSKPLPWGGFEARSRKAHQLFGQSGKDASILETSEIQKFHSNSATVCLRNCISAFKGAF